MTSGADVIRSFCAAWGTRNIEKIVGFLAPDVFYHNIPLAPIVGRANVSAAITPLIESCSDIDWEILHIAEAGSVVLTERADRFVRDGKMMTVPVMGAFELEGDLIARWRDYFDLLDWQKQSAGRS